MAIGKKQHENYQVTDVGSGKCEDRSHRECDSMTEHGSPVYACCGRQSGVSNSRTKPFVRDAYETLQTSHKIVGLYQSGYLDWAQNDRDISEYACRRGPSAGWIFSMPDATIGLHNLPVGGRWRRGCRGWSNGGRRWGTRNLP